MTFYIKSPEILYNDYNDDSNETIEKKVIKKINAYQVRKVYMYPIINCLFFNNIFFIMIFYCKK